LRARLNPYDINIFAIKYFWLWISMEGIFDRNNGSVIEKIVLIKVD